MRRGFIGRTALLLVALAAPLYPCGGPESYPIDAPLVRADAYLQALETVDDFDFRLRPELRFLHPFLANGGQVASEMWMYSYSDASWNLAKGVDTTARFDFDSLEQALDRALPTGNRQSTEVAASALLNGALDVPATVSDAVQPSVRRAVEALEILAARAKPAAPVTLPEPIARRLYGDSLVQDVASLPQWAREVVEIRELPRDSMPVWGDRHPDSPRQGSLRFVELQLAMRRGIPDGWARETRDSVPPERWRQLAALHDAWMQRFPNHPLAPWVQLSRLRLAYFQGDSTKAWDVALDTYRTHRWRALDEMRFLLRQPMYPPSLDDPRIDDTLRAALLGEIPIDASRWEREWRRAQRASAPWASAVRERLMWRAARDSASATDGRSRIVSEPGVALSPLANALRLVALVRAGDVPVALRVADSLALTGGAAHSVERVEIDSTVAPIRVQLLLAERRWIDALHSPGMPPEARQYLVRVMAPDSVLEALVRSNDRLLSREARRTRALRRASAGDWTGASAMLPSGDGELANRWRAVQPLAADTTLAGRLAFARYMRAQNGKLFGGNDKVWYRSLNWRQRAIGDSTYGGFTPILPWRAEDEVSAIGRHFHDTFEMYYAVKAYADFLARLPKGDPRRAVAVREADQAYNWLLNWDNYNATYWARELEAEGIGGKIRRAGRK